MELEGVRALLVRLDPGRDAVAVVAFSETKAQGAKQRDAWIEAEITSDYSTVETALRRISDRSGRGSTHTAQGIRLAARMLKEHAETNSRSVMVVLTEGNPTLPHAAVYGFDNARSVGRAAASASRVSEVHVVLVGNEDFRIQARLLDAIQSSGGVVWEAATVDALTDCLVTIAELE